ncbi:MAG: 3'-5' exonuclease [Candidatus Omnitrophica bacterium]|nr:3'-5' exonuclease [Candidatus Omnitrophota bacterium]
MDISKNINDYNLAFLDLETTGLDVVMGDAICEIGALKVKDKRIIDKFHTLVNPGKSVPIEAYKVHKISDEELKFAPLFEKVADKVKIFLNDSVVCAYNVGFDMGFLDYQLKNAGLEPLFIPAIDILSMARDSLVLNRYNLESVAQHLGIDCSNGLHRALDDSMVAYQVFFRLIEIYREKGIEKLNDFVSLYGFSNDIVKTQDRVKAELIKDAISRQQKVYLKHFSANKVIENERVLPLRILEENRRFFLLYQGQGDNSCRICSNRILDIVIT